MNSVGTGRASKWFAAGVFAMSVAGCGGSGVSYSGVVAPRAVTADLIEVRAYAFDNEALLGYVEATCREPSDSTETRPFPDWLCTDAQLQSTLLSRAAEAGGTALVQTRCGEAGAGRRCGGLVVRREPGSASFGSLGRTDVEYAKGAPLSFAEVTGFDVLITTPDKPALKPALEPVQTRVVPRVPVSDFPFGQLTARCELGECREDEVRESVVVLGTHFGADHVVFPECWALGAGFECRAMLSAHRARFEESSHD